MIYFLDFDRTLFDTDAFAAHVLNGPRAASFKKESEETITKQLEILAEAGDLSFTDGELKAFVYKEVPEFLRMRGNDAVILTYGNRTLQKMKIENALSGIPRLSVIYAGETRKGIYMKDRIAMYGAATLFLDDRAIELEDMARECPQVRLYEMRRDGASGDGRWPVVRSLSELP